MEESSGARTTYPRSAPTIRTTPAVVCSIRMLIHNTFRPRKTKFSAMQILRDPLRLIFFICFTVFWIGFHAPVIMHGITEAKYLARIEKEGTRIIGTVKGHDIKTRARSCGEYAQISYDIEGREYIVNSGGCNAHHSKLPVGSLVKILYLPNHPDKGIAQYKGSQDTSTAEWFFVTMWCLSGIFCAFMSFAIIAESLKNRGCGKNAAAS